MSDPLNPSHPLQPLQFEHYRPGKGYHHVDAIREGLKAGHIRWSAATGEITSLSVDPGLRRQGIATAMYNHAKSNYYPPPAHSSARSPEGSAFARSTGDKVPKLKKAIPSEDAIYGDEPLSKARARYHSLPEWMFTDG